MIDAGVLPRDTRAMPLWHGRPPRAYRHGRGRWRGWPPRVRGRVRLRWRGVEGEALCCLCVRPARAGLDMFTPLAQPSPGGCSKGKFKSHPTGSHGPRRSLSKRT